MVFSAHTDDLHSRHQSCFKPNPRALPLPDLANCLTALHERHREIHEHELWALLRTRAHLDRGRAIGRVQQQHRRVRPGLCLRSRLVELQYNDMSMTDC